MSRTSRSTWVPAAVLVASVGLAVASNIAFAIKYTLLGPGDSASGTNWLSLPYHRPPGLDTAADLFQKLGGAPAVVAVARWNPLVDGYEAYTGSPEDDFALAAGEATLVQLTTTTDFKIAGSHNPTYAVTLLGPEASRSGTNSYAPPFHALAATASQLRNEIGSDRVVSVQRWLRSSDGFQTYNGSSVATDFPLVPGEGYRVVVNKTTYFVPKTRY